MTSDTLQTAIEAAWDDRASLSPDTKGETRDALKLRLPILIMGLSASLPNLAMEIGKYINGLRKPCFWVSVFIQMQ